MFEQLIETEPKNASAKNRKSYFIISTVAICSALFTALIFSLFAVDLNLGMGEVDMVSLLAPVEITDQKLPEPELKTEPKPQAGGSTMATRQVEMARIDETPREIPTTVSTAKNGLKERLDNFKLGAVDSDLPAGSGSGRGNGTGNGDGDGLGDGTVATTAEPSEAPPPPPVKKQPVVKEKPIVRSMGIVNSIATSLPRPEIPAAARAVNATGTVSVQVLIDEKGRVISASAVSGNSLLRLSSEAAARSAKFTPTLLSGTPIQISGIINYHFLDGSAE